MICADQWRPDMFGADRSYTPNVDALAKQGITFGQHYAQALPCAPSRASVYTGLYATHHGVINNGVLFDERHKTIGHYLRESGYNPTLFGYTDTKLSPDHPEAHDTHGSSYSVLPGMVEGCHQPDDCPRHWLKHLDDKGYDTSSMKAVYAPDRSKPNGTGGAGGQPAQYAAEDSDTGFLVSRFMDWQGQQDTGWCAMLNFLRPHRPTIAPEPFNSLVDPMSLSAPIRSDGPEGDAASHPYMDMLMRSGYAGIKVHQDLDGLIADMDEKDWRSIRAIHMALMAEIDANLGRVFQQLKDSGEWDNTLIIFTSDHGEMMFDHHICQQASWHDQCTHLPMILFDPAAQDPALAGSEVTELTAAVDTIPTLMELLGQEIPEGLDGRSMAGFVTGKKPDAWRDEVFWQFDYGGAVDQAYLDRFGIKRQDCIMSVVRTKDYKYAAFPGTPSVLVDLTKDPLEMGNVSGQPEYAQIEADLAARLDQYLTT